MSTVWGCDTEAMEDLAETMEERVRWLIELLERLREASSALAWTGPDARAHRRAVEQVIGHGLGRCAVMEQLAADLRGEAAAQERASARDPSGPTGLPPGESFALGEDHLAHGEWVRRRLAKRHPVTRAAQQLMDAHAALEGLAGDAESSFDRRGWEVPAAAAGMYGHALGLTGLLVGEESTLGQATVGLERLWANGEQTVTEVLEAVGEGDPGAALRAGERGLLRNAQLQAELLTAGPTWYTADGIGHVLGGAADALEPVAPEAAGTLHEAEQRAVDLGADIRGIREEILDAEAWYEGRRTYAPMPWDPYRAVRA